MSGNCNLSIGDEKRFEKYVMAAKTIFSDAEYQDPLSCRELFPLGGLILLIFEKKNSVGLSPLVN